MRKFLCLLCAFALAAPVMSNSLRAKTNVQAYSQEGDLGYYEGYIQGMGSGLGKGRVDGYNQASYNPNPPSNYFQGDMHTGYADGFSAGYATGYTEGQNLKATGGPRPPRWLDMENE